MDRVVRFHLRARKSAASRDRLSSRQQAAL